MTSPSAARRAWRAAHDLDGLCALAAAFLEGELPWFPGWMAADVDEETDPLVPDLLRLCRAAVLPLASQPGHPRRREHDERLWSRRAFLTAFAAPEAAQRLLAAELPRAVVRVFAAEANEGGAREPVGLVGGVPYLWTGAARGGLELELFAEDVGARALAALRAARYVSIHDRAWGRGAALFGELARALGEG